MDKEKALFQGLLSVERKSKYFLKDLSKNSEKDIDKLIRLCDNVIEVRFRGFG